MLASLDDLVATGALPANHTDADPRVSRGTRLLEMASAQVLVYLRLETEEELAELDGWTDAKSTVLATIVAEAAGSRLNVSAAPSSDPYSSLEGLTSALLNRRHYAAIDRLLGRGGRGSQSLVTERDTDTSFLSLPVSYGRYDPYHKTDL